MRQTSKRIETGERPLPKRGFAGRGLLAAGLLKPPLGKEEQIFHSNIIRESVGQLVQGVEAKARFQEMVITQAQLVVRLQNITPSYALFDKTPEQLLVERVLRRSGAYKVRIYKRTPTGTAFTIIPLDGREIKMLPVSRGVFESQDPERAIEGRLEALGVINPVSEEEMIKAKTRRFGCFSPPSIEHLGISQEDLEARKLTFEGEVKGASREHIYHSLSFTYNEETTLQVPADLSGEQLILALEKKIAAKQLEYAQQRLRMHRESGFDTVSDTQVRKAAQEIYDCVFMEDDSAIPERYKDAVETLRGTSEYNRLVDIRNEGIFTAGEIIALRKACRELDHPARVMVQDLHRDQMAHKGTITDEGKERMSSVLHAYGSQTEICEDALRNLADAYRKVMDGPERDIWRKESLMRMHFQMMHVVMKAIDGLHRRISG